MTSGVSRLVPTGSALSRVPSPSRSLNCRFWVDLEDQARGREHVRRQMRRVGVAHDHRGEGVVLHLAEQMQAVEALQVVEAVAVLQLLHLHFEDEVEGRAQHAAERHDLFGKAADPEIDVLEAAKRTAGSRRRCALRKSSRSAGTSMPPTETPVIMVSAASRFSSSVVCARDQRVRAVGGDEVDDRRFVLEVAGKVDPAVVGLEQDVLVGRLVELTTGGVQRRHAGVAAARQVDGREVEGQAQQVVAQRGRHELVDFVADLTGHAADDGAGGDIVGDGVIGVELYRIEEALDQADMVCGERRIEAVDRLGQHGVAEAIDHMGELGHDRRIDRRVEPVRNHEHVDVRLDLAREFLEHEVLILHLGAELGGLEQALAVPHETRRPAAGGRQGAPGRPRAIR